MPGKYTDSKSNMALMNTICDMSQFVVFIPVPSESSATLADHFFQHMLTKFGLCYIVVLNDGNPFKGAFVAICKVLKLNYDILFKRNDKELSVEHFHRFLKKATTISMENRQNNDVFVPTGIVVGYA